MESKAFACGGESEPATAQRSMPLGASEGMNTV